MPKDSSQATERAQGLGRPTLEAALAARAPTTGSTRRSRASPSGRGRPAAVLIAIEAAAEPLIYFTQRAADLKHHPGQISFPGGRVEADDRNTAAAALREAQEEIGLDDRCVHLLGQLPVYRTVTGFDVTPHVAWLDQGIELEPDGVEVVRLFTVPLCHAMDPANYRVTHRLRNGVELPVYSLDFDDNHIWGATAAMLLELVRRVARVQCRAFDISRVE